MQTTEQYDLVIVGGGIGGSALAAVMAEAGRRVLVLEKSEEFEDQVRGEWIAPWGVTEARRVGLYDVLVAAGGHHVTEHVTFDETLAPDVAEAGLLPLGVFAPNVPGPLCLGHPTHCQALIDEAARRGAVVRRGIDIDTVTPGPSPRVTYSLDGVQHEACGRLVVGADGRSSVVREAAAIALHADRPHHMFGGMLVADVPEWNERRQAIGTEGDFAFLVFPQGGGRLRVYGSYSLDERRRFSGPDGPARFLEAFRMKCSPENRFIAEGRQAGPLRSYFNNDSWTDRPFAEGIVLIGDAAGWNDPINGLGLSITYRDVRMVSELLLADDSWAPALFESYADERHERMRRLRFVGSLQAALDAEFGPHARARRHRFLEQSKRDPSLRAHLVALMAGPEAAPAESFTPTYWDRVLGTLVGADA
jgi:2-polyprenyl-6-methoxyphenol hydroxylase-like FAD-dependent oxidoreductase